MIDVDKLKRAAGKEACFLEVGHGSLPAFRLLKKVPLDDQLYLGLDIRAERWERRYATYDISDGRRQIDGMRSSGKACFWSYVGTEGLPLPPASVDTLYMQMVTNDSMIGRDKVLALIREAARVLRKGGVFAALNSPAGYRMFEAGDLLVLGSSFGMAAGNGGRITRVPELEGNFAPLPPESHLDFIERHGGGGGLKPYIPGKNISVFTRV